MKTVIIEYAVISPAVLANKVEKAFSCLCNWKDIDEDYFEFTVIGVCACRVCMILSCGSPSLARDGTWRAEFTIIPRPPHFVKRKLV